MSSSVKAEVSEEPVYGLYEMHGESLELHGQSQTSKSYLAVVRGSIYEAWDGVALHQMPRYQQQLRKAGNGVVLRMLLQQW